MHAIVSAIGHNDVAFVVNSAALWSKELTIARALAAEKLGRLKVRIDDQETVIVEISDYDLVLLVECNASRRVELFPQRPIKAILVQEDAIGVEQLDTMISRIGYQDVRLARDGHVPRIVEVRARFASFLAELEDERAIVLKYLDTVVVFVGDHDSMQLVVIGNASRSIELSSSCAVAAELSQELAGSVEHLDAVVGSVCNDDVSLRITADAPRSTELSVSATFASAVDAEDCF